MASQSSPAGIDQDALERRIDLAMNDGDKPDPVVPPPASPSPKQSAAPASSDGDKPAAVVPPPESVPAAAAAPVEPALSFGQRLARRFKRLEQATHLFLYRHHYLKERVVHVHAMVEDANSRLAGHAAFLDRVRQALGEDPRELRRDIADLRRDQRQDVMDMRHELAELRRELAAARAEERRDAAWQRAELAVQRRRLERVDDGATAQGPLPGSATAVASTMDPGPAPALRFGLPDAGAADRYRPHLDLLRRRATLVPGKPLLDLGCGHGDWLAVLQAAGIEAAGVDSHAVAIEACRQRGLPARLGDPLAHLSGLPDGSICAITGFLLLERIDPASQALLIEQARRALVPGGFVEFECLSPDNLLACLAAAQQSPPVRPLATTVMEFMLSSRGFINIDVVHPEPAAAPERLQEDSEAARRLNALLYGPRTYLISARRA